MNNALTRLVPRALVNSLLPHLGFGAAARRRGLSLAIRRTHIDLKRESTVLRISAAHAVYLRDAIDSFEYYVSAVVPVRIGDLDVVDYSTPRYHDVVGFDAYPILFPSLAEPLITTSQYLDFAALRPGMTVLDLGAYSGLTSILFCRAIGPTGTVVAVEADRTNIACVRRNFANFHKYAQGTLHLCEGAVWRSDEGVAFSVEGNMGSSAASIVGANRGDVVHVHSFTLSDVCARYALERVDFIKCDVEGAEREIFGDEAFFRRFRPRIIIEPHVISGVETTAVCVGQLERLGYTCRRIEQHGVPLPLLQCSPTESSRLTAAV